ncbi:MAG TPA: hypothetical protein VF183_12685 [Acidimicrobiales bacterium]
MSLASTSACFVPVGTTADALESSDELNGEPHAPHGMIAECEAA